MGKFVNRDKNGVITSKIDMPFDVEQAKAYVEELSAELTQSPANLVLTDISSLTAVPPLDSLKIVAKAIKQNRNLIKKSAVILESNLLKQPLQALLLLSGRHDIKVFSSPTEAVAWFNQESETPEIDEDEGFDLFMSLLANVTRPRSAATTEESKTANNLDQTKKILILEDNSAILNIYQKIIETKFDNIKVFTADNGQNAIKLAESNSLDIIFSDLMLPEMSGWDFIVAVRKMPQHKLVPIIVMSALADKESVGKAIKAGASDFMIKPVSQKILIDKVSAKLGVVPNVQNTN